jgi:cyanophycinase
MSRWSRTRTTALVALLAGCASHAPPSSAGAASAAAPVRAGARGTLYIVGGGTQSDTLVRHFIDLAGGAGRARIAILPMASEESAESGRDKAEQLRGMGADAFVVDVTREQAATDSVARLIDGATGIWFPGGDQARLTRALLGTATLRAIHARFAAGAVVGGTSAGAAIMSDSMITGDQRRPGVDTVGTFDNRYPRIARGMMVIAPGLGFLHGAIVDQHFIRRERQNRLVSVVLENPTLVGVGIDEGTAVRVDPDGRWTVEGRSAAIVYDAREASVTSPPARLGAAGVRVHLLPAGSTFDPATGRATLPGR